MLRTMWSLTGVVGDRCPTSNIVRRRRSRTFIVASLAVLLGFTVIPATAVCQTVKAWWPESGTVILGGGGLKSTTFDAVAAQLIASAGGPNALIVIIPTANPKATTAPDGNTTGVDDLREALRTRGALNIAFLHTRDRRIANSEAFAAILGSAGGVWIPGGNPRVLESTYRGTLVERELHSLLRRGGVVFGDSAGAFAIGCYSLGWTPDPFGKIADGLSLLPHVTATPHANVARGYDPADEVLKYLSSHPSVIGVTIDENTALVLHARTAEVLGQGSVAILDPSEDANKATMRLYAGTAHPL